MDTEKERLVEIVKKFNNKKVGVVGDVLLDSYLFGKVERINPDRPGYPLLKVERQEHRLGGAGNVAANLISLGANVVLFGAIGDDLYGTIFRKRCRRLRVKFIPIIEGNTLLKQRRIEITHKDYLGREDFGEAQLEKLSEKSEKRIFKVIIRERPEILILSDYNKRIFRGDFAKRLINWAKTQGISVIVDPKPDNIGSLKGATLVRPNLKEAREIVGKEYARKDIKDIIKKLKGVVDSKYVVISCGSDGMASYDEEFYHVPTEVKELTDVTGAGDTVIAALALAILSDASLAEATYISNCAAGIVVERLGTASVTQKELIDRINQSELNVKS